MTKPGLKRNFFPPRHTQRRGSALVLSIVTIVMMVMLGAAYLQMARIDRRTAAAVDTRSNADESSILRYIGNILQGDIPTQLDGSPEFYDYPWSAEQPTGSTLGLDTTGPYDLTQRTDNGLWLVEDRFAPTVIPGPVPDLDEGDLPAREPRADTAEQDAAGNYFAEGNHGDDTWLASNEPDAAGTWPHITNLMGVFLDLDPTTMVVDPSSLDGMYPLQYLSTADANDDSGDTGALQALSTGDTSIDEFKFADADGDGIYDSRWTWAPLPSDGGLAYVMAVRIIDNSALVDLNTWSFNRTDIGSSEDSRWLSPGELDLESALDLVTTDSVTGGTLDAPTILMERNVDGPTGEPNAFERMYGWLDGSAVWRRLNQANDLDDWEFIGTALEQEEVESPGSTGVDGGEDTDPGTNNADYERLRERTNELELRWRNGLNRALADKSGTENSTDLEDLDLTLFRDGDIETAWDDNATFADEFEFFFNEPRKMLTTISGSAEYARVDINEAAEFDEDTINATDDLDDLAEVFEDSSPDTSPLFTRGVWTDEEEYAAQAATIVRDFIDQDSELTGRETDAGNVMFGMEYLPFISEVYLQARYTADVTLLADPTPPPSGRAEVTWTHVPGDYSAAIELVNPWPWTIEIPDVELFVDDGVTEESWGTLQELLPAAKTTLDADEMVVLIRRDNLSDNTEIDNIPNSEDIPTPADRDWPVDAITPAQVEIRMAAATNTADRVIYQRFFVNDIPRESVDEYIDDATLATDGVNDGDEGYLQYTFLGTGNGLNALAVRDIDVESIPFAVTNAADDSDHPIVLDAPQPIDTGATDHAQFDTARKGATSTAIDTLPLGAESVDLDDRVKDAVGTTTGATAVQEPWIIGNAGRMYRTGDLLRAVFLGPRRNAAGDDFTVADVWKAFYDDTATAPQQYEIKNLMLDLSDTANNDAGGTSLNHAAYYLTKFSTLNVNNGQGGLVSGRPNINTMSERMLAAMLPTRLTTFADDIASDIVAARQDPMTAFGAAYTAEDRGIPFVAELRNSANVYDFDGSNGTNPQEQILDFNELDAEIGPDPGPTPSADGFTGDIEEQTVMLNYLNQTLSTRSDIYTAYVLVRAYSANDFTNGTPGDADDDVIDEFRLIAVFDRSNRGFPRILTVRRFADATP